MSAEQPRPWFRARAPAEVVRDALAMAARKRREGCDPCVDAYLSLARKNGATEEQIAAALRTEDPPDLYDVSAGWARTEGEP